MLFLKMHTLKRTAYSVVTATATVHSGHCTAGEKETWYMAQGRTGSTGQGCTAGSPPAAGSALQPGPRGEGSGRGHAPFAHALSAGPARGGREDGGGERARGDVPGAMLEGWW